MYRRLHTLGQFYVTLLGKIKKLGFWALPMQNFMLSSKMTLFFYLGSKVESEFLLRPNARFASVTL